MLMILNSKNAKGGYKLELTYEYARCIVHIKRYKQISKWNAKGDQKSF